MSGPCTVEGCTSNVLARGFCKRHYDRWRRHGDPSICLKPMVGRGEPMAWLREHATYQGQDCLLWPFARFPDGRAHMKAGKPSRFMCALAHGPAPSRKHEAAHSCGKGHEACVNPLHLRWATKAENDEDKLRHGTTAKGGQLPQSKLTPEDVRAIRALKGVMLERDIAKQFGIHFTGVNKIIAGKSWRHVL